MKSTNQIIQKFNPTTDEIMPEIDSLENISKWCLCAEKKSKDRPFFNDKKYLIQKLKAIRMEHSMQFIGQGVGLGTKSREKLFVKIKHNFHCLFKLLQGAELAIKNDKLILACHMLLYAGRLNERARILQYEDSFLRGIKAQKKSSKGGVESRGQGKVQKNPAIREFMITHLLNQIIDGKGKLPYDAKSRTNRATLKEFSGIVSKDTLKKSPFKKEDLMPEVKKRFKNMK